VDKEKYKFTMKAIKINELRSALNDTLSVSIVATINGTEVSKTSFNLGDRKSGYYDLDQQNIDNQHSIEFFVGPDSDQNISLGYIVANVNDGDLVILEQAATQLAAKAASSAVTGATIGSLGGPIGTILGVATGIIIDILGSYFKPGRCDGIVAADTLTFKSSDIKNHTKSYNLHYPGSESPSFCGDNSDYWVESNLEVAPLEISWTEQKATEISGGSHNAPALAVYKDKLYMAWRGCGDDGMWFSYYDGDLWAPQQRALGDFGKSNAPALATYNGKLYMAWRSIGDDPAIYYSEFDGSLWKPQQKARDFGTSHVPALAFYNGKLYMAWQGCGGDTKIWFSYFDGASWKPQQIAIGEQGTSQAPTLASWNGKLYMAWRSIGDDPAIYYSNFDGSLWKIPGKVRDICTSHAPALAVFHNKLYMAWQGCGGDTRMWVSYYNNNFSVPWMPQQLAGEGRGTSDSPALAEYKGNLHMAWKGMDDDVSIWFSTTQG